MKAQTALVALTAINLALLAFNIAQTRAAHADTSGMLRGRGLQIVDDRGRVRASISVMPANPSDRYPDGRVGSPETVLLRLIDEHGKPNVKIGASEEGGGLGLGGGVDPAYARIAPEKGRMALTLTNREGADKVVTAP
ncbi:MAG: hypothetical protein ACJ798_03180 [Phenylobacterium sp.]